MSPFAIPTILALDRTHEAVARVDGYYLSRLAFTRPKNSEDPRPLPDEFRNSRKLPGGDYDEPTVPYFAGSCFDTLEPENNTWDQITSSDLAALSLLSVPVGSDALVEFLHRRKDRISELLRAIPEDAVLWAPEDSPDDGRAEAMYPTLMAHRETPGWQLWNLRSGIDEGGRKVGFGPTRVSKLLYRKRPHLFPIWDSKVGEAVGAANSRRFWADLERALRENRLHEQLTTIRERSTHGKDLSLLRVFDVAVWHAQKYSSGWEPERTES